ncbi:glutamate--tRNA ligase [Cytobacillus horneckiae]|uniref:Glutamate--tRNA ligase n=1 Tax=Cytobacillus horneckiae TaxID=549687 RepID=A0A2N0ZGX4_9BACI|nr:glutamate--tRNA ligase [Cytobacillus horneckiae]MEC1155820.1 glutamate--tRNA ligase [Cytobacillus horneckiae]MED2938046.1 glutamate--tRNA ligase [Cytobacillus horneckiae]PKG28760.1 glutamate--tRNA ligase [Cytobacillus horneckiae]
MSNDIRVRYAPSPTGHLHIGNARTALFNYLYARNQGGKFIIRIEDTDKKRNIEGGEQSQLKYLQWLGIDWDESVDKDGGYGPYRQSERNEIYEKHYNELLEAGKAYKCYCTEEELEAEREAQMAKGETPIYSGKCRHLSQAERAQFEAEGRKPSIRFLVPQGKVYTFDDMVKGEVSFESDGIGDHVIVKKDGTPTYNFAVAVDDYLMKISHVLRGDDHISNTPKQLMIYEALGWEPPRFGHMTLIVNESRKKLSKRDESIIQFIEQYEELGYLPEALFNFIALLGWSPSGEEEIFSKDEFIEIFDASRLSKSPALFDKQKLAYMNNQYMKKLDVDKLVEITLPHLIKAGKVEENLSEEKMAWVKKLVALFQEKMSFGAEIVELTDMFFTEELMIEDEAKEVLAEEEVPEVLSAFLNEIDQLESFEADAIKASMKSVQKATGHKGKKLFMPIRSATTGQTHGPDLPQAIELLGKDKIKDRLASILG